jgi:mono/diheme cytochrome c family protein
LQATPPGVAGLARAGIIGADPTQRVSTRVRAVIVSCLWIFVSATPALAQVTATAAQSNALTPFARAKTEALLAAQLPCLGCHALNGAGGKLAPDLATVRERRDGAYIARIVSDPQGTVPGTLMPHTPMPAEWRALVVRYLGGSPLGGTVKPTVTSPPDANGATLYAKFCTGCHGARGNGDGPNAASLPVAPAKHASRDAMSLRPDDSLYDTISGGGTIMNRSPRMPAYGTTLTPAQIRALVRHIRTLCQCSGPSWSTDGMGAPR